MSVYLFMCECDVWVCTYSCVSGMCKCVHLFVCQCDIRMCSYLYVNVMYGCVPVHVQVWRVGVCLLCSVWVCTCSCVSGVYDVCACPCVNGMCILGTLCRAEDHAGRCLHLPPYLRWCLLVTTASQDPPMPASHPTAGARGLHVGTTYCGI